jgi:putative nucleotidyltransferase with HDIG domain
MEKKPTVLKRIRQTVLFLAKAALVTAGLATLTVFVGPLAAALGACALIWAALVAVYRSRSRERKAVDARLEAMRDRYSAIINALSSAMGLQDDMKASHSRRVSDLTFILAQQMGLRREDVQLVQRAAVLADIGKMEIAQSILSKPGELSEQEWVEMKQHPELGARVVSEVLGTDDTARVVLAHHERFDGQGYPGNLRGEEIPLGARIYAVADAYLAMTSDRPHRKKMSHEMALKEILRNSLTQFDPEVVRAFVRAEEMGLIGSQAVSTNGHAEAGTQRIATEVA